MIDMTGKRVGRLIVISRAENDKYGNARWRCKCICGKFAVVNGSALRNGHTRSCGCLQADKTAQMVRRRSFGDAFMDVPYDKRLLGIFNAMKQRSYNPNNSEYRHYGGKGVMICDEWLNSFPKFHSWALSHGYERGLTIDRIDNSKGYMPENCRFTTKAEQNRNTTRTHRILDETTGRFLTAAQVAQVIGVSRSTAAKWFRGENLRTLEAFRRREARICNGRHQNV